jgi:protein disulfide-isomerase
MVHDYQAYRQKMQQMGQQQRLSGADLKQIYDKALELHFDDDVHAIIAAGLNSDMKFFFQMERYRMLAEDGNIHKPEARDLREQLVASDPNNERKTHYQLAVIDFEDY